MSARTATPGLVAGILGVVAGLAGAVLDAPVLALVAGAAALVAGLSAIGLARGLQTLSAAEARIEEEVRALRSAGSVSSAPTAASPTVAPTTPSAGADELQQPIHEPPAAGDAGAAATEEADRADHADRAEPPAAAARARGPHPSEPSAEAGAPDREAPQAGTSPSDQAPPGGAGGNTLKDPETGLYSEDFFQVALEARIAAARRHLRPIAMVLLDVVEGLPSSEPTPVKAELLARTIESTLREADTACRFRTGYFALLLEDTPENGAIWTVERIRRQLLDNRAGLTVWAGVACYPAHGFSPEQIVLAAERALELAREWRQDRIEVAVSSD